MLYLPALETKTAVVGLAVPSEAIHGVALSVIRLTRLQNPEKEGGGAGKWLDPCG
jgi:hypothetical protein